MTWRLLGRKQNRSCGEQRKKDGKLRAPPWKTLRTNGTIIRINRDRKWRKSERKSGMRKLRKKPPRPFLEKFQFDDNDHDYSVVRTRVAKVMRSIHNMRVIHHHQGTYWHWRCISHTRPALRGSVGVSWLSFGALFSGPDSNPARLSRNAIKRQLCNASDIINNSVTANCSSSFSQRSMSLAIQSVIDCYTLWVKTDTLLMSITSEILIDFQNSFTARLSTKSYKMVISYAPPL